MLFYELVIALCIAALLTVIFVGAEGRRRVDPESEALGASIMFFFLLVFIASWAGGLWLVPLGPPLWGVYWVPFAVVGIIVALLFAAVAAASERPAPRHAEAGAAVQARERDKAVVVFGLFFSMLIVGLSAAIVVRHFW